MNSTTHARPAHAVGRALLLATAIGLNPVVAVAVAAPLAETSLSIPKRNLAPIAAAAAVGDMSQLDAALNRALDAGPTVSEAKEILLQLYAYAGFPRSLNALGELMNVLKARKQRGVDDAPGREPGKVPAGQALLARGTANQTQLFGGPVKGPLFDFPPAADEFLKRHLFGAIFARDNLDWQSPEIATVGALAAMPGVESQLSAHVGAAVHIGLTPAQWLEVADALTAAGQPNAARRTRATVENHLARPDK